MIQTPNGAFTYPEFTIIAITVVVLSWIVAKLIIPVKIGGGE